MGYMPRDGELERPTPRFGSFVIFGRKILNLVLQLMPDNIPEIKRMRTIGVILYFLDLLDELPCTGTWGIELNN